MRNYEMITVVKYLENLEKENLVDLNQKDICARVEKYLASNNNADRNERILNELLK